MVKKIIILIVLVALAGIAFCFSKKQSTIETPNTNTSSTPVISNEPRLIGNGTETYNLTGYYYPYTVDFYKFDEEAPTKIACKGFVVTSGNSDFIEAYKTQIKKTKQPEGNIIINFDNMTIQDTSVRADAYSPLSPTVTNSTASKPITLVFKVWPFPGRDTNPCDSYGIYIPAK